MTTGGDQYIILCAKGLGAGYAPISDLLAAPANAVTAKGIWKWDGTTWSQVTPNNPNDMEMSF